MVRFTLFYFFIFHYGGSFEEFLDSLALRVSPYRLASFLLEIAIFCSSGIIYSLPGTIYRYFALKSFIVLYNTNHARDQLQRDFQLSYRSSYSKVN